MKLSRSKLFLVILLSSLSADFVHSQEGADPKIVQAARKEGETLFWYTHTMSSDHSMAIHGAGSTKYPFLKPSIIRWSGAPLSLIVTSAGWKIFAMSPAWTQSEIVLRYEYGIARAQRFALNAK